MNSDLIDLLQTLNENDVKYLVVGAYAVMFFTEPRYTKDLDIWVEPSKENARKVWKALADFGAPLDSVSLNDFVDPDNVFQIGIVPNRVDILMGIDGNISFNKAWNNRLETRLGDVKMVLMNIEELIQNKAAVNRLQDQIDLEKLRKVKK